jgi:hypothetical protein
MRRGPSDERGPLRRGQLETQSGSLLERIRRGRAAALPEFEEPLTGLLAFLAGDPPQRDGARLSTASSPSYRSPAPVFGDDP